MRARTVLALGGVLTLGLWLMHGGSNPQLNAGAPTANSDYSQRVVAYIYGNVPITREDLGEYLIARQGVEKLDLLVNKRIIEHACQEAGIEVTAAEVKAAFDQDLGVMRVNSAEFVNRVLKQYGKTLYEWNEDVLKPRLMLQKFCQARVKVEDDDIKKEFESRYGDKVECRIIIWPKGEDGVAFKEYDSIRKNEESFARKAATQAISSLAAVGGRIMPIAHYSGAHPEVEKQAFMLEPGEVSSLIETPEGKVCIKVDRKLPADGKVKIADVRADLEKAVFDKKITQEIPLVMKQLREKAKPVLILKKGITESELEREVAEELKQTGAIQAKPK